MFLLYYILAISPKEVDVVKLSIALSLSWLPSNVIFIILYLRAGNSKPMSITKPFNAMSNRNSKKFVKAVLIDCIVTTLAIILIFKGAERIGCVLLFVSLFAFIYYWRKLVRKTELV